MMIKKIKSHKKIALLSSFGLILIIVFTWFVMFNKPSSAAPSITEGKARIDNISVSVENDGVVMADKAVLNFSQAGMLQKVNYKIGDKVQAGDVLAELDSSKLNAQVEQAQSTYSANLEKAKRLAPGGEEVILKQRALDAARSALIAEQNIYNDVSTKYGAKPKQT
jgi:HlyD family secretion protein